MWEHWYWQGHISLLLKLLCSTDYLCFGVLFHWKAKKSFWEKRRQITCIWMYIRDVSFLWPHIFPKRPPTKTWLYIIPNTGASWPCTSLVVRVQIRHKWICTWGCHFLFTLFFISKSGLQPLRQLNPQNCFKRRLMQALHGLNSLNAAGSSFFYVCDRPII